MRLRLRRRSGKKSSTQDPSTVPMALAGKPASSHPDADEQVLAADIPAESLDEQLTKSFRKPIVSVNGTDMPAENPGKRAA